MSIGASDIRPVRMPDTWDAQDFATYENPPLTQILQHMETKARHIINNPDTYDQTQN